MRRREARGACKQCRNKGGRPQDVMQAIQTAERKRGRSRGTRLLLQAATDKSGDKGWYRGEQENGQVSRGGVCVCVCVCVGGGGGVGAARGKGGGEFIMHRFTCRLLRRATWGCSLLGC
jgi:hypothetical protein